MSIGGIWANGIDINVSQVNFKPEYANDASSVSDKGHAAKIKIAMFCQQCSNL